MTPDPTLTDEELATIEEAVLLPSRTLLGTDVQRLIAALRASREEVKVLRADVESLLKKLDEVQERPAWRIALEDPLLKERLQRKVKRTMTEEELKIVKATWKAAYADVGTSTLAYRALSLVPRLFDEIDRLRGFLDAESLKRYESEAHQDWRSQQ